MRGTVEMRMQIELLEELVDQVYQQMKYLRWIKLVTEMILVLLPVTAVVVYIMVGTAAKIW